jgi:hypothetical protein
MNRLTRDRIRRYLEAFDFAGLFTDPDLGWDWPESKGKLRVPTKSGFIDTEIIADKRGVKVLHLAGLADGEIPASDERKAIEKAITPLATEHLLIFTDKAKTRQVWLWTSRLPGKPISYRELTWEKGKSNELLLQKLASIAFTISEEESLDITGVVERLRDSLDRDKVTKRFYDQFKTQKDEFRKFIKGISDGGLWDWYTSLMLNRLMFCYFLQRKGFLDGDLNYLSNRLDRVRDEFGKGKFHSFYKTFLRRLFHEGLGQPKKERTDELKKLIGEVPYLNGGIFEEHKIEREHPGLHIPDEAFEKVFAFLNGYDWHLDDRPIASGKEINPEILGYVFEKYTNQKEMGAYYTKEDITDYIAKNCIIPFLLDAAGEKLGDASWNLLREDPDRYIYPAVGHGIFCDYPTNTKLNAPLLLPDYIEQGVDTSKPDLRKRREKWNESATSELGLPTEIWRETVARRQCCEELQRKLRNGEVGAVNDLITLNFNVRQFAQDVVESAPPDLLLAVFKAIRKVSVLDPTCGSGAFLFAALNILEPLYRASLDRMRMLIGDWDTRGDKHPNYRKEFSTILDQAALHPNENYFIFKSIIVHSLYGVDIMEEAVEICKLRLFLKLAAQLEPGQEIEPLPDIDFNIRTGNTLIGYATRQELRRAAHSDSRVRDVEGRTQSRLTGIETDSKAFSDIEEGADILDSKFRLFQEQQDKHGVDADEHRKAKNILNLEFEALRKKLNEFLAASHGRQHVNSPRAFETWCKAQQPFHWFVEFYGILNGGGFDVIIGNPPWVEFAKVQKRYHPSGLLTLDCNNLWAFVVEQSYKLLSSRGRLGLIVPMSLVCTERMRSVQQVIRDAGIAWVSNYESDSNPGQLFVGVKQNVTILLGQRRREQQIFTTRLLRFFQEARGEVFGAIRFAQPSKNQLSFGFPKVSTDEELSILAKLFRKPKLVTQMTSNSAKPILVHRIAHYYIKCFDFVPYFRSDRDGVKKSEDYKEYHFNGGTQQFVAAINSTAFYLYWQVFFDAFKAGKLCVESFPFGGADDSAIAAALTTAAKALIRDLKANSVRLKAEYVATGRVEYDQFYPRRSKTFVDEIDVVLAKHYGFSEEELDFIINYDIKYRVGLGSDDADE